MDRKNPVSTGLNDVLASVYIVGDETYIAVANFSKEDKTAEIRVKGYENAKLYAPKIKDFQGEEIFEGKIELGGGKGKFLRLIKNDGR